MSGFSQATFAPLCFALWLVTWQRHAPSVHALRLLLTAAVERRGYARPRELLLEVWQRAERGFRLTRSSARSGIADLHWVQPNFGASTHDERGGVSAIAFTGYSTDDDSDVSTSTAAATDARKCRERKRERKPRKPQWPRRTPPRTIVAIVHSDRMGELHR